MISPATRPGPPLPVRVRPDGTFSFGDVQGGDVYIGFVLAPDSKYFIKLVSANGEDPKRTPIRVTEGTEAGPVQIVISEGVGTVTGRVLSETGTQGMSNIVVLLAPTATDQQRFRTAYLSRRTATDGAFSISGPPGEYFVFARQREDLPALVSEAFVRNAAASATRVVLISGETKRIDLRVQ